MIVTDKTKNTSKPKFYHGCWFDGKMLVWAVKKFTFDVAFYDPTEPDIDCIPYAGEDVARRVALALYNDHISKDVSPRPIYVFSEGVLSRIKRGDVINLSKLTKIG